MNIFLSLTKYILALMLIYFYNYNLYIYAQTLLSIFLLIKLSHVLGPHIQ